MNASDCRGWDCEIRRWYLEAFAESYLLTRLGVCVLRSMYLLDVEQIETSVELEACSLYSMIPVQSLSLYLDLSMMNAAVVLVVWLSLGFLALTQPGQRERLSYSPP